MARKVLTQYVDDISGNEIPDGEGGPVTFALDGQEYEIDLTNENADVMRETLSRYVSAARRLTRQSSRRSSSVSSGGGRSEADREHTRMVRAWAVEHGHMKPDSRGRIPNAIVEMYENRNTSGGSPAKKATAAPSAEGTQTTMATPAPAASKPQGEAAKPSKVNGAKKETAKEPATA